MGLTLSLGATIYPPKRNNGPMDASLSILAALSGHLARILPLVLGPLPSRTPSDYGTLKFPNTTPTIQCLRILRKWSGSRPLKLVAQSKAAAAFLTQVTGLRNTMYASTLPQAM
jgi:hypothetical protein